MPLVQKALSAALLPILNMSVKANLPQDAGRLWGAAYDIFARTGAVAGIPVIFLPPATLKLQQDFGDAFKTLPGVPLTVATQLATAMTTYWATGTVVGMLSPPAAAASVPIFIPLCVKAMLDRTGTAQSKADDFAAAFYAFTAAVVVSMPPAGVTVPVV